MEIFVLCIIIVACAVEFYKKTIRGIVTDEGIKTKANKWEIIIIAFILSALMGLLYYKVKNLSNIYAYFLVVVSIYFLQYFLDMKLIKSVVKSITNRL